MTNSRASTPITSSRVNPVTRSQASLNNKIRPSRSRTETSDIVVSVRTLANSSPRTNSARCDIEKAHLVVLEREPGRAHGFRRELAELVACRCARPHRLLVGPQGDDERLRLGRVPEPDQPAEAGAVAEPGQELVTDDLEAEVVLLLGRLEGVQARER